MKSFLLSLEQAYDNNGAEAFNFGEFTCFRPLVEALRLKKFREVYDCADSLFGTLDHPAAKAFALKCAVAAAELEWNMAERERWISRWHQIPNWSQELYCIQLRAYHGGLTAFFSGNLREAEARFRHSFELATSLGSPHHQMRGLFQLGLVFRDRQQAAKAAEFFELALESAKGAGAARFQPRVEAEIQKLSAGMELDIALHGGDVDHFRQVLARAEALRRKQGLNRGAMSLYIYVPLVQWLRGRDGTRLYRKIKDPVLQCKVLSLKEELIGLSADENAELQLLREQVGIGSVIRQSSIRGDETEICGVPLRKIPQKDVSRLMLLFLDAKENSLDKAAICAGVWGLDYDPVLHDKKVYKLIDRTKQVFGRKDLLVNLYGAYQLNPKFFRALAPAV